MTAEAASSAGTRLKDHDIQQRQADAARLRAEREQRLQKEQQEQQQAQEELRENTKRRQIKLQCERREEDERELAGKRQTAFERCVRADPESLVGRRAHIDGTEGTIESWHSASAASEGHWQILLDDGREETLMTILVEQLVGSMDESYDPASCGERPRGNSTISDGFSPSMRQMEKLKKGTRLHIDGYVDKCVVVECYVVRRRDQILDRLCINFSKRPTHMVLFDNGTEDELNLNRMYTEVLPDLDDALTEVFDALYATLRTCKESQADEEVQKAIPRLESLEKDLQKVRKVFNEFPAVQPLAKSGLDKMVSSLNRVSHLVSCQCNGQGKQVQPKHIAAELKLALEDMDKARWDLQFQLNLATAQDKTALQAAAAREHIRNFEINDKDIVLGSVLGRGGFATVHNCNWQGEKTAAKIFDLQNLSPSQKRALMHSFNCETEVALNLRSPRVLQVYGICTTVPDCLYIIMELATGGSVRGKLDEAKKPLSPSRVWKLALDTALGMRYLHDHGIMHRDIKSHNVLLDINGRAQVADFGIARAAEKLHEMSSGGSTRGGAAGTTPWMAPEALNGEAVFASDVFSFGVFVWELATRQMPWAEDNQARIIYKVCFEQARLPMGDVISEGHATVPQILSRCWEQEPEARPSFEELERECILQCNNLGVRAVPEACAARTGLVQVQVQHVAQKETTIDPRHAEVLASAPNCQVVPKPIRKNSQNENYGQAVFKAPERQVQSKPWTLSSQRPVPQKHLVTTVPPGVQRALPGNPGTPKVEQVAHPPSNPPAGVRSTTAAGGVPVAAAIRRAQACTILPPRQDNGRSPAHAKSMYVASNFPSGFNFGSPGPQRRPPPINNVTTPLVPAAAACEGGSASKNPAAQPRYVATTVSGQQGYSQKKLDSQMLGPPLGARRMLGHPPTSPVSHLAQTGPLIER